MYSVMLADDEHWIVEGLKASIDWQSEGFFISQTAENGLDANRILKTECPDLVLIDIRMPGMNGLDVIKQNRAEHPETYFVIISGFSEFEYARAGIDMNVYGYLLKPVDEQELLSLVRRIKVCLDAEKAEIESSKILDELDDDAGYVRALYPDGCFIYMQLGGELHDIPNARHRIRMRPRHYMLISPNRLDIDEAHLSSAILGLGEIKYSSGDLFDSLTKAAILAYSFFSQPGKRVFHDQDAPCSKIEVTALQSAVMANDVSAINSAIKNLRDNLPNVSVSALFKLYSGFSSDGAYNGIEIMVRRYRCAEAMLNELERTLTKPSPYTESSMNYTPAEYIKMHCAEDISFIDVCKHFSMSATSMRSLLQNETSMNFSQYLNKMRMKHACELLHSKLSVNDIASACGFCDPLYFRKVFKRYTGRTPSEYRSIID